MTGLVRSERISFVESEPGPDGCCHHLHVVLVGVAVANPLNLLRIPQQLLSSVVHGSLDTGRFVRGEYFQRDLFGSAEDSRKVELLSDLRDVCDREWNRRGKGDGVVKGDGSGKESVGDLCSSDAGPWSIPAQTPHMSRSPVRTC